MKAHLFLENGTLKVTTKEIRKPEWIDDITANVADPLVKYASGDYVRLSEYNSAITAIKQKAVVVWQNNISYVLDSSNGKPEKLFVMRLDGGKSIDIQMKDGEFYPIDCEVRYEDAKCKFCNGSGIGAYMFTRHDPCTVCEGTGKELYGQVAVLSPIVEKEEPDLGDLLQNKDGRNWTEDSAHENGKYTCKCGGCGHYFIGHKRRVRCKLCMYASKKESQDDLFKSVALIVINGHRAGPQFYQGSIDELKSRYTITPKK